MRHFLIVAALVGITGQASAQELPPEVAQRLAAETARAPIGDLRLLYLLRELSKRTDALQQRQDLTLPRGSGIARLDRVDVMQVTTTAGTAFPQLNVWGWAYTCDNPTFFDVDLSRIALVVDDIETGDDAARFSRPDVKRNMSDYCRQFGGGTIPTKTGVFIPADVNVFQPGLAGDGWHTVKIRVYDFHGRTSESPELSVFVPIVRD